MSLCYSNPIEPHVESFGDHKLAARPPLGQQVHLALVQHGPQAAVAVAQEAGQPDLFARVSAVAGEAPSPSFLHSALCAMSLPVRRPRDEHAPIIRQDGQYTLVINPKPVVEVVAGHQRLQSLGVPYGSLPRLVLIHIMTEAVRTKSRQIVLGKTFTDWMRRMGFRTISYGPRGSATLIREQLDRLLACEWMIRWDNSPEQGEREFGIKEIKLTNEYAGIDRRNGSFVREIHMTEGFFDHLREHAVPLNENAIRQIRDSATALDLYTWLAYRLPRINPKRPTAISWQQLAVHFGNDGKNIRKFRQTVRDAWERQVSAVYPEAKADFDTTVVRLYASPAPLQQKLIPGAHLQLASDDKGTPSKDVSPHPLPSSEAGTVSGRFLAALSQGLEPAEANAWLKDASLDEIEGTWVLQTKTRFIAHYISTRFDQALRRAAAAVELTTPPAVRARSSGR
jgi:Plasmid encoded RepA protein